ncbi:hypothetical protein M0R45_006430 [Rubus argutus]|uniref:hAT-like transposase RNase-H fold domain-containing protein n=1 Tax=Rubus argutus TaxID=59490 RepID=A0AAW1YQL9_RUBAR
MSSMSENSIPPPAAPVPASPAAPVPTSPTTGSTAATTASTAATTASTATTTAARPKTGKKSGLPGNHGPSEVWAVHITKHIIPETKNFYDITMRVSGSCYVTSTTYMDEIKRTKAILDMHVESADYELRAMALLMNEKFEKYCKIENVNPILLAAMVLDPRNKMQYAVWMFKKYWGVHLVDGLVAQLKDFMTRLYNQYKQQDKALGISTSKRTLTDLQTSPGNQQVSDGDRAEFNQYLMEIERVDAFNDLDKYLQDRVELGDAMARDIASLSIGGSVLE